MLNELLARPDSARLVFEQTGAIQLTDGCSLGCYFCGLDVQRKKLGNTISFTNLFEIFSRYQEALRNNSTFFYWASDPLDWEGECDREVKTFRSVLKPGQKLNYFDLGDVCTMVAHYTPIVSTSVPKGKEELAWEKRHYINRISLSEVNNGRLLKAWGKERFQQLQSLSCIQQVPVNPALSLIGIRNTPGEEQAWVAAGGDPAAGIGSFDGVVVQPSRILNVIQVPRNDRYKNGVVSVSIALEKLRKPIEGAELGEILSCGAVAFHRPPMNTLQKQARHVIRFEVRNLVDQKVFDYVAAKEKLSRAA